MIGESIVVLAGRIFNQRGEPVAETAADRTITGCAVAPRFSDQTHDVRGRHGVLVGLTVYAPAGTRVAENARVMCRGDVYEVDGEPAVWVNPYEAAERGVEILLRRGKG